MEMDKPVHSIVFYFLPPLILIFGLTGNICGLITFRCGRLFEIGSNRIYKFIFLIDSLNLLNIIVMYLANTFGIDVTLQTNFSCKLVMYLNYTLAPISPMLFIFNSLIKLISFNKNLDHVLFWFKKKYIQIVYAFSIILFNLIYYLPALFVIELQMSSNSNSLFFDATPECTFIDTSKQIILFSMDLFNRVFIPFTLLIVCSMSLLRQIFNLKNVTNMQLVINSKVRRLERDIQSAITLICLNVSYVILNIPIVVILFTQISFESVSFSISLNLYYLSYGINFYIILITNSSIRRKFCKIFKPKRLNNRNHDFELDSPYWV